MNVLPGLGQAALPFVYVELDGQMGDEVPHDIIDFWQAQRQAVASVLACPCLDVSFRDMTWVTCCAVCVAWVK